MNRKLVVYIMVAAVSVAFAGCKKKQKQEAGGKTAPAAAQKVDADLEKAKKLLRDEGIDPMSLKVEGGDISLRYEASGANNFEDELVVVWGQAFGILSHFARETVTIVNTVNGVPITVVTAQVKDILAASRGVISEKEFLSRLDIKSVK